MSVFTVCFQIADECQPIGLGHHHIGEYQVRDFFGHMLVRLFHIQGALSAVPAGLQDFTNYITECRFIIYDKDNLPHPLPRFQARV